jgi:hypothetical protein
MPMTELKFTGWLPIGLSPKSWEGKPVFWRDHPTAAVEFRVIPIGFSRLERHCGETMVAGVAGGEHAVSAVVDLLEQHDRAMAEAVAAERKRCLTILRREMTVALILAAEAEIERGET